VEEVFRKTTMCLPELHSHYDAKALEQLSKRAHHRRSAQRLQAIYLKALGKTSPEIAFVLGCSPKTVRIWIKRFNAWGPDALEYRHTGGRRPKLSPEQEEGLMLYLREGRPDGHRWTLKALAEIVFKEYGVQLSQQQVSERVRRQGLSSLLSKSGRARKDRQSPSAATRDQAQKR
jgi:transposase